MIKTTKQLDTWHLEDFIREVVELWRLRYYFIYRYIEDSINKYIPWMVFVTVVMLLYKLIIGEGFL